MMSSRKDGEILIDTYICIQYVGRKVEPRDIQREDIHYIEFTLLPENLKQDKVEVIERVKKIHTKRLLQNCPIVPLGGGHLHFPTVLSLDLWRQLL
jgi:hypothetical protein